MRRKKAFLWFYIALLFFVFSCSKQTELNFNEDMSLFAFIISDNDLDDHTDYIESDLVKGLKGCQVGTEMFLYVDRKSEKPSLRHFFLLESGKVGVNTVANYDEQCSTSSAVFRDVLNTMIKESSGRRYGIIYWSHGNGWMPGLSYHQSAQTHTRAIGLDGVFSMNVDDFGEVLRDTKKPYFVVFDACFMGAVEVAYSLRYSTDYLIASSAETLGVTFPYHLILPDLIEGSKESMSHSLDTYLDYCKSDYYGDGTISGMASLIDCSKMDELALSFKRVLENGSGVVNRDSIQFFDCSWPHIYYDLGDYVHKLSNNSVVLNDFDRCLEQTVVHSVTTPSLYSVYGGNNNLITVNHYSGLSVYVSGSSQSHDLNYVGTEWYKYCYDR